MPVRRVRAPSGKFREIGIMVLTPGMEVNASTADRMRIAR